MKLGIAIANDTWHFFDEIYKDLCSFYDVNVFKSRSFRTPFFRERVNRFIFHKDLENFMKTHDVIFFEWASELLVAATHYSKYCHIVTRLHRYEMFQWVDKVNWDRVDKIILVSYAMHKKFSEKFPDQKHKVTVIPEAIPIEKFQYTPKEFRGDIGILCHLSPRKRVYELILVFYEMLKTRGDFHLHIAGDLVPAYGDYFDAIQSLVKKLGIEDQVTFYGEIFDAWNWYSKIDIFISNSYSEGLQVAPIEAMASGRYCLSHRWDGAEELLPENNLFYTDQDLQEKILAFCQLSSEEKQKSSRLMRELACEKFDINQTKAQIRRLIQDVALGKS